MPFVLLYGACALAALACLGEATAPRREPARGPGEAPPSARIALLVSADAAPAGERVSVALDAALPDRTPLAGLDGELTWDSSALEYAGFAADSGAVAATRPLAAGRLRLLVVRPRGLAPAALRVVFTVRRAGYAPTLGFTLAKGAVAGGDTVTAAPAAGARTAAALGVPAVLAPAARIAAATGPLTRYGDVDASGTVDLVDALAIVNWSVGNGAPADTMTFNAANVAPANSPGTGGEPDEDPPGWGAVPACDRTLDLLDALAVTDRAVGNPAPVAGEPLPDAWLRPVRCGGVPSAPADTLLRTLRGAANLEIDTVFLGGRFRKEVVTVIFAPGTSRAERQAIIDEVGGTVVGGLPTAGADGWFYVHVPRASSAQALGEVITRLKGHAGVSVASPDYFNMTGKHRSPVDGPEWTLWQVDRTSADGENWALEAIRAPLAWGCTVGEQYTRVGVIDYAFKLVEDLRPNVGDAPPYSDSPQNHGTLVASILAARGDNGLGTTGVMWSGTLELHDFTDTTSGPDARSDNALLNAIARSARSGARIVNLSVGFDWRGRRPYGAHDSLIAERAFAGWPSTLRRILPEDSIPLLVISAGNEGTSALFGVTPLLRRAFPDRVIVVAGSTRLDSLAEDSNRGSLSELAAPSADVYGLTQSGRVPLSGTSAAAPLVAGVAGLVLSLDPSLSPISLRRLVLAGAQASGRRASGIPILDAYESLKLASRTDGTPLCGNRVWTDGRRVLAERGEGPARHDEVLFDAGGPVAWLQVHHGGRRIDVRTGTVAQGTWELENGAWRRTGDYFTAPAGSPAGAANSLFGYSHDGDSLFIIRSNTIVLRTPPRSSSELPLVSLPEGPRDGSTFNECIWERATIDSSGTPSPPVCRLQASLGYQLGSGYYWLATAPLGARAVVSRTASSWSAELVSSAWSTCPWPAWDSLAGRPTVERCRGVRGRITSSGTDIFSGPTNQPGAPWAMLRSRAGEEVVGISINESATEIAYELGAFDLSWVAQPGTREGQWDTATTNASTCRVEFHSWPLDSLLRSIPLASPCETAYEGGQAGFSASRQGPGPLPVPTGRAGVGRRPTGTR